MTMEQCVLSPVE